jgi:hypothetical protein
MTYNYFYYGQPIAKSTFTDNVPSGWQSEILNGEYSFGGYRAIERG